MGFDVNAINTVHFSNHPAYKGGFKGQSLNGQEIFSIFEGLQANNLLNYDVVISGYIRSEDVLLNLKDIIKTIKDINPSTIYVCDPVLGDNGMFYVPQSLLDIYKTQIIPLCQVIVPNFFEIEVLTGIKVTSISSALEACRILHHQGPKVCLLKGLPLDGNEGPLTMILSIYDNELQKAYQVKVPRTKSHFSGCGDLCSAMTTAFYFKYPNHPCIVLDNIANIMTSVVTATANAENKELLIIESIDTFRNPPKLLSPSYIVTGELKGVIFDMDGTLTEDGAIDFQAMYTRIGMVPLPNIDLIARIENFENSEKERAMNIILEEEIAGCDRMKLREDTEAVLKTLRDQGIRTAISTRNCEYASKRFVDMIEDISNHFHPILARDNFGGINKPDPRVAEHILNTWGVEASTVWFVGDSRDDMLCGKLAGCRTCFITDDKFDANSLPPNVDVAVNTLTEFLDIALKRANMPIL